MLAVGGTCVAPPRCGVRPRGLRAARRVGGLCRSSQEQSTSTVSYPCCIDIGDAAEVLATSYSKARRGGKSKLFYAPSVKSDSAQTQLATLDDTRPASWFLSDFVHVGCAAYVSGHDLVVLRRLMDEYCPASFNEGPRLTSGERRVRSAWLDVIWETLRQRGTPSRAPRPTPSVHQLELGVSTLVAAVLQSLTSHPDLRPYSRLMPSDRYSGIGSRYSGVCGDEDTVNVHMVPLTQLSLLTVFGANDLCAPCEIDFD